MSVDTRPRPGSRSYLAPKEPVEREPGMAEDGSPAPGGWSAGRVALVFQPLFVAAALLLAWRATYPPSDDLTVDHLDVIDPRQVAMVLIGLEGLLLALLGGRRLLHSERGLPQAVGLGMMTVLGVVMLLLATAGAAQGCGSPHAELVHPLPHDIVVVREEVTAGPGASSTRVLHLSLPESASVPGLAGQEPLDLLGDHAALQGWPVTATPEGGWTARSGTWDLAAVPAGPALDGMVPATLTLTHSPSAELCLR